MNNRLDVEHVSGNTKPIDSCVIKVPLNAFLSGDDGNGGVIEPEGCELVEHTGISSDELVELYLSDRLVFDIVDENLQTIAYCKPLYSSSSYDEIYIVFHTDRNDVFDLKADEYGISGTITLMATISFDRGNASSNPVEVVEVAQGNDNGTGPNAAPHGE